MNRSRQLVAPLNAIFNIGMKIRRLSPRRKCNAFSAFKSDTQPKIENIYVINLDRRLDRWVEVRRELQHILDSEGNKLLSLTIRYSAIDALDMVETSLESDEVYPFYTLGDQLFVEPQPRAMPMQMELTRPIPMTIQEVAVALSHINIWKEIASGESEYVLILEDDVWFKNRFERLLDQAWEDLISNKEQSQRPDLIYLSYKEVLGGAPKNFISENLFCPNRGLWYLSGYILSRQGAHRLLQCLPCRGPVDLWINHQFDKLNVRAISPPVIQQRLNGYSSNSYSILPVLNKIGVIDSDTASLFQIRPTEEPVFVFGSEHSDLSSVAMALLMLGYTCCSDLEDLPTEEKECLFGGYSERIFNAYVNIGALSSNIRKLKCLYPTGIFIATLKQGENVEDIIDCKDQIPSFFVVLYTEEVDKWRFLCEQLRCAPPACSFPKIADLGQRRVTDFESDFNDDRAWIKSKHDRSPWIIESHSCWMGIETVPRNHIDTNIGCCVVNEDFLATIDYKHWVLKDDTFPGNLALFRPENVEPCAGGGITLSIREESLHIREYSAAAISSRSQILYGRFEADFQVSKVPGVVTGFFLHRDSPRQEIDIEIVGHRPDRLLTNVFYNPGDDGTRYDYGYRGTPYYIDLGFDASLSCHRYAIEWEPDVIRWFVDDKLVHRRNIWGPTPIPHLPMTLYVNSWPSKSRELAGRLKTGLLPAVTFVRSISIDSTMKRPSPTHSPHQTIPSLEKSQ